MSMFNDDATGWGLDDAVIGANDGAPLPGDVYDDAQMQTVTGMATGQGSAVPWWQQIAVYGITRAIDNRFGPVNVQGNVSPGSFAGQNGVSYPQNYAQGGTTYAQAQPGGMSGGVVLLLLLGAALALGGD